MIKHKPESLIEIREYKAKLAEKDEKIKLLEVQNQVLSSRSEFIEDCLAEMAAQVYSL